MWGIVRSKIKTAFYLLFGFLALGFFQNCGYVGKSDPTKFMIDQGSLSNGVPSYQELYDNIFSPKCMSCHAGMTPNFGNYDNVMSSGSVVPFQPNSSRLYQRVNSGEMPQGGPELSAAEKRAIYAWIEAGALNAGGNPVPDVAPDAPSAFAATAGSTTSIILSWSLPAQTVTGVQVTRAPNLNGPYMVIANLAGAQSDFTDTGLAVGTTYYYRITLSNSVGNSPVSDTASATTSQPSPTAPLAPTNLTANASSTSQINLSWTDNSSNETGFKIERALAVNGPFTEIDVTAANVTTYASTGLDASTTYYYRVSATNAMGTSPVVVANATTSSPAPTAPNAPTNLMASAASTTQINLSWTDSSNNETGFKVERSTTVNGNYTLLTTTAANVTTYQNTGLTASTTYFYRVSAVNAVGTSATTDPVSATTQSPPAPNTPTAPTNLTATATSTTQINLAWTDSSNNETGFKVERATTVNGNYMLVTTTAANVTSYSNTGLAASTTFYYRVAAINATGSSNYTAVATATTQTPPSAPSAPSAFTATATSTAQINLAWTDNSSNETGFKIERSTTSNGTYTLVTTTAANATSYSNTGLAASTTYYYRVFATNAVGDSSKISASATTQTPAPTPTAPTAPTTLTATATSASQINLSWTDSSDNETGFKIERSTTSNGTYTLVTTTAANVTSYSNTGLAASTAYYYRVFATNAVGDSSKVSASATTQAGASNPNATYTWIAANVTPKCTSCHGANRTAGYDFRTYTGVMAAVRAGSSANSKFYTQTNSGSMPKGGADLDAATMTNIKNWIDGGALNN